ncbi:MAG TPA: putative Ig domain-containing protein [Acidobacteriaceae bacterium]|nr:putative Ig domain-containing protein [Acidobacteriaceae bacterium]
MAKLAIGLGFTAFFFLAGCGGVGIAQAGVPNSQLNSAPLTITTTSLPNASVGVTYNAPLTAAGGNDPYTWKFSSGKMPAGLALNGNGSIYGTPTVAGTYSIGLTVRDKSHPAQEKFIALTMIVSGNQLGIVTGALPAASYGTPYSQTLQAKGGAGTYSWAIAAGALPSGLSLSGNGTISGTPTAAGTFSFSVRVTDQSVPQQTSTANLSIVVSGTPLSIATTTLTSGTVGTSYTQALSANGGTPGYTWSLTSGTLPSGLTLGSTGIISGTPAASGTFAFGVAVSDKSNPAQTALANLSIAISATPLKIGTTALAGATIGSSYSQSLSVSGGTPGYVWSVISGALPTGLSFSPAGVVSGTPTATGNYSFTAKVVDSGNPVQSQSVALSISVAATPLAIASTSFPQGTYGRPYAQSLQASGGTQGYTWSIVSGSLPAGLTLNSSTGAISGIPTGTSSTFTASVKDSSNPTELASKSMSISVSAAPLTITAAALPSIGAGSAYSQTLLATGGTTPYKWVISSGQLPAGLTLSTTGVISGTTSIGGTATFTATVTDSSNPIQSASVAMNLTVVSSALSITSTALAGAKAGSPYSQALQVSGGTAPYVWTVLSGQLPPGLSLSTSGVISGTPLTSDSGNYSFTFAVTDAGSPAQTASAAATISLSATPLAIVPPALATGTTNTAYAQTLQATGGTPAYTWSITSGSLPAGMTFAATTGTISGTPTTAGTSVFTATVKDSGSPAQVQSVIASITVNASQLSSTGGNTWYIRPDGGTRYSKNVTNGQCDGLADAPYPGSGVNQHCAFKDYRYLWDDQSYGNDAWVISGGDTVIIRGGPWRVGYDSNTGPGAGYTWCVGGNGPYSCSNPTIPSGTPTQHTRILGENWANCSANNAVDKSKLTQIFGGYGVWYALNLSGSQYVDVQCLEITSHAQCISHGYPAVPRGCNSGNPSIASLDDYDSEGVVTSTGTQNVLLQDVYIHGHTDRGVKGPIGGTFTCLRCDIYANGMAGWDFDDGSGSNNGFGTASLPGATWNFLYSTIEWNGCNQIWPNGGVDTCYSQSTGGYGDGVGTPPGMCLNANIDHSSFNYNTQDGLDLGHLDTGNCKVVITNSIAIGNSGGTFKTGANATTYIFENNLALANCLRLSQPISGASSYYNANLADYCRAGDNMSFNFRQGGTALLANNTVVGYQPTQFDIACWDTNGCSNSTLTFKNNITMGYDNPSLYNMGGQQGGTGSFYFQQPIGIITRSNNLWYGIRSTSFACPPPYASEFCANPSFVNEPTGQGTNFKETELDNFNFALAPGSPAIGAGIQIPGITLDYTGVQRANPPSIGAYEQ